MLILGPLCFGLVFLIEYISNRTFTFNIFNKKLKAIPYEPFVNDDDVEKEITRTENTSPLNSSIHVLHLRKVFKIGRNKHKVAVEDISFCLDKQECYCLLGVNGAGKTTTFKILTNELLPTKGTVHIFGYDVSKDMAKIRTLIGYCP